MKQVTNTCAIRAAAETDIGPTDAVGALVGPQNAPLIFENTHVGADQAKKALETCGRRWQLRSAHRQQGTILSVVGQAEKARLSAK